MQLIRQPNYDLSQRPFMVIWETTQACDLACRHCRAHAQPEAHPEQLTFKDGCRLIDQIIDFGKPNPLVIFTGGDPFKRADIFDLTRYAASRGLPVALSPSGTPLLNHDNLAELKEAGCRAISLSLDASCPEIHDTFRGVPGSFDWTIGGWKMAQSLGLKLQINTTVTKHNLFDLPKIFALVRDLGAMTWSVFFLVPTGRGQLEDEISPDDYEAVMNFLYDASKYIGLKTTEGHHFKRVVLQRAFLDANNLPAREYMNLNSTYDRLHADLLHETGGMEMLPTDRIRRTPLHVNAADGFVFVSLLGHVFPSGYLPVSAGNIRETHLKSIYQDSELFLSLRAKKELKGRCGACEFNRICGGSRSRAYAMTGDLLAEEPYCAYVPGSFPFANQIEAISDN